MQVNRVRTGALTLPEVEEGTHFGVVAFAVRGKNVASLSEDGGVVQFRLPEDAVEAVLAEHPSAERITRQDTTIGVGLPVDGLDVRALDRLLRQAWEAAAPKRPVAERTEEELLALHGVGPKAVRILREALAVRGLAFRAG